MVDFQSSQWVFFSIDSEKMLIGLSQSVWLITNIYVYFLDYFLWDLYLPDYFFHDLLYFCFFFFWPIRLDKLLNKIIVILRKLWANVIVDAALRFKGFNHFPFTWLDLEQIDDCLNFFLAVSSAAEKTCLLSHGYFFLNQLNCCQSLIVKLIELFIYLEVKGFLFEDWLDGVMAVFDRTWVPSFEHLHFLHLI